MTAYHFVNRRGLSPNLVTHYLVSFTSLKIVPEGLRMFWVVIVAVVGVFDKMLGSVAPFITSPNFCMIILFDDTHL